MICPDCKGKMWVIDTIPTDDSVIRRRKYKECGYKVYTKETTATDEELDTIFSRIKFDRYGSGTTYSEQKLRLIKKLAGGGKCNN